MPPSTLADFQALIGTPFRLVLESGPMPLVLKEARALGQGRRDGGAFSLVFEGEADARLVQSTYRLESDAAVLEVFLVPIGPFGAGMGFEAVFT